MKVQDQKQNIKVETEVKILRLADDKRTPHIIKVMPFTPSWFLKS